MAEVFGVAASAIALIELFAKIGVLCSIYCAGVKAAPQDIRNILNEADRCTASLRAVERLVTRPNGIKDENARNLHRNLETCRTLLDELAVKLEKGTKLGRLQWPLDKKSVTNVVKKLEQCRSAISLDLQVSQTDLLLDANQESVLAKLRTVNGASYDAYNDAESSTCLPNTRVEILQQIQEWGASTDEECIFWLNGMAGTGKSTISRTVAQTFAKKKMLGASFFFKRGEGDRGHAGLFIPTIAAQLVQKTPDLAEPVYQQMYYEPAVSDKSINIQFETLIQRPFQELPQRADPPILVVVVDALDECDRLDHVKLITHLLSQAKTLQSVRLKFFMTSRPELPITLGFQTLDTKYKEFILHEVPEPIIKNDIDLFLEIQLSKIKQDYNKSVTLSRQLPPDWPGDRHQKRLVELATPLFIFAATVCRFIQDRRFGSPQRLLARFLENQADVGSKLQATYRPVLDQLLLGLDDSEKEEVAARFREIVGSIVALADPLTTHSLSALLEIPQDMIEDQLDLLHSVLQVPATQEDPVRLLHLSFRDYLFNLDKASKSSDSLFSISETRTHERMAGKCLKLLSRRLKRDICDLGQQDFPRADIEGRTLDAKVAPEVQYACRYWVEHWRLSGRKIQDEDITHDFFRRHLLHWLEALTLLGLLREGISLVDKLSALLKPNESVVVSSLLSDTRRFILSNLSTVDEFPLQLYYSAIIFAPTSSLVRQTFKQEFPVWLPEPPTTEANWGPFVQSLNTVSSAIWVVAISPDSKLLAIGTNEDTVEIWDPGVGLCMATLYGHDGLVMSVAFSSDSALLATTSDDFVMIWDLEVYECIASLEGHTDAVTDVAFQPNSRKLASASYDNTIRIWDLSTNTCTGILKGHLDVVQKLTFSHDARLIASASSDSTLKLWDVATGKCRATLEGHTESVESVTFSPDSTLVASSSDDESIKIWNIATATCVATLEGHDDSVESVAFSPRSSTLASASLDGTVKLWDVSTGECFSTFEGHTNGVQSVAFSPDGRILASASRDATVRLWDTEVKPMTNKLNHGSRVKTFKLSGDGKFLVSITNDDSVSLYNVISSSTDPILEGFHDATMKAVFSPDSRMLLTASKDHAIKLWDLGADVSLRATYSSELNFQWGIHISGDSSMIALVSRQSAVKLLDTVTGEIIKTVDSAETEDTKTVLSQDFGLVALASDRNDLRLSDIDRTREDVLMSSHSEEQESLALAFSPDSSTLASATSGAIKLWNTSSRACVATIPIHNIAFGLAFSADASSLHTGFGTIMLNGDLSPRICPVHLGGLSKDEAPTFVETHGLGFGQWNDWITWGTRNLVRVPLEQRYLTCIIRGSTLVMKTTSGRLLIMKASADDDLYA